MERVVKRLMMLLVALPYFHCSNAQEGIGKLRITSETIRKYTFSHNVVESGNLLNLVGYANNSVLYEYKHDWKNIDFYILEESEGKFEQVLDKFNLDGEDIRSFTVKDSSIFYVKSIFRAEDDEVGSDGYSIPTFWYDKKVVQLDSLHYADKNIEASFSTDGEYLLVNTLSELTDYYQPSVDDYITVYSIDSLKKGLVSRRRIPCELCADSHLVDNQIFFTKSNIPDDLWGGYAWPDIYMAPWGRMQDSVKIAATSDILAVSPEGKYILAKRKDLPNGPRVIIDVSTKKYQLLPGRQYQEAKAFYSYAKKKFAFDFGDRIVYVDFPKEYPFNALDRDNPEIPFNLNLEPFQHASFD